VLLAIAVCAASVWAHPPDSSDINFCPQVLGWCLFAVISDVITPFNEMRMPYSIWPYTFNARLAVRIIYDSDPNVPPHWHDNTWHRAYRVRDTVGHTYEVYQRSDAYTIGPGYPDIVRDEYPGDMLDLSGWGPVEAWANAWSQLKKEAGVGALHQHHLYLNQ